MYLLPRGFPHSPHRYEDTLGIVFERVRGRHEMDGIRWYQHQTDADMSIDREQVILYEKYFKCVDLGSQIKQAIEEYHESSEFKSNEPISCSMCINNML